VLSSGLNRSDKKVKEIPPFHENQILRDAIRRFQTSKRLAESTKSFLRELFGEYKKQGDRKPGRDGACRHTREQVSRDEVNKAIDAAIEFIDRIKELRFPGYLQCKECNASHDFLFSAIFNARPGGTAQMNCPIRGKNCFAMSFPVHRKVAHLMIFF